MIKYTALPLKYNNYYNRILKIENSIDNYKNYLLGNEQQLLSFDIGDGISKSDFVLNMPDEYANEANYMVITQTNTDTNETTINSRWFILESKWNRNGQTKFNLYRDAVAEKYSEILDSPIFIEKATLTNINDPAIYNSEDVSVNQIKTSETLLKDETGSAWVVGYIPSDAFNQTEEKDRTIGINYPFLAKPDITVSGLSNWEYYNYYTNPFSSSMIEKDSVVAIYTSPSVSSAQENRLFSAAICLDGSIYQFSNIYGQSEDDITINGVPLYTPLNSQQENQLKFSSNIISGDYNDILKQYRQQVGLNILQDSKKLVTLKTYINDIAQIVSTSTLSNLNKLEGKIIYDSANDFYYKIHIKKSENPITKQFTINSNVNSFMNNNIKRDGYSSHNRNYTINGNGSLEDIDFTAYKILITYYEYQIQLSQSYNAGYITMPIPDDRYHLEDQPYDMFCIPYSDDLPIYKDGSHVFDANRGLALGVSNSITTSLGSNNQYDVQLLPYCPVRYNIRDNGTFDYSSNKTTLIKDSINKETGLPTGKTIGAIYWANSASFTFNINNSLTLNKEIKNEYEKQQSGRLSSSATMTVDLSEYDDINQIQFVNELPAVHISYSFEPITKQLIIQYDTQYAERSQFVSLNIITLQIEKPTVEECKIENQCSMYRLCSPNYNGQFEFNLLKTGNIDYFNVDCSYKPYSPYIHVNPNFSRLYGSDFDDARGLICSGDFSLPQITSTWANYQANNKNYQNIFNREIQNLETTQNIQRIQEVISSGANVISAGALGGIRSGIGAGIGAGLSIVGGIADYALSEQLRNETLNYKQDMFKMNLQNIQAIPYSLSNVGAFNRNNKIFPFIEYYTCTDTEKQALKNKMKYNGMTIGRIGTISEFNLSDYSYIKGQLIRTEINGDFHFINVLSDELNKGLFIRRF